MAGSPRTALRVLLAFALSGCATTNSAWLSEPEAGMSLGADLVAPLDSHASYAHSQVPPAATSLEPAAENAEAPRTRLQRTLTLSGETSVAEAAPAAATGAPAAPSSVVIVNNYVTTPSYGGPYDGYYPVFHPGHGRVSGDGESRARTRASPPRVQPAQDFPAPPSYGPTFPYKTAPASPWK